jgi:hypothetical protein
LGGQRREVESDAIQPLMARVLEIVQIVGVIDDALQVALVVAHVEFKLAEDTLARGFAHAGNDNCGMNSHRANLINKIRALPQQVAHFVAPLPGEALTSHYLAGEWSIAQNVHHLFDSHANSYIRCKLILTEDNPPLKPYDQDAWAALPDAMSADVPTSLALLRGLHARWVQFFEALGEDDWQRRGTHLAMPDTAYTLDYALQLYADHGEAHLDQMARTLSAR